MVRLRLFSPQTRLGRWGFLSGGGLLLIAAILVFVNLLSQILYTRLDWTADNRYSLTPATRHLIRSLEDPLLIRFYLTPGLPQPYATQGRYVMDILHEYRTSSRGKISLEVINPEESQERKSEAGRAGVIPARFTQVASDQFQIREGFLGVVLYYQDKQEVLPFVKDTESLEYDISSRIKRMISTQKPVLGFVTGHGEMAPYQLQAGDPSLFEGFEIESISLSTDSTVAPDILFLIGPRQKIDGSELAVLEDHLSKGVPLALFINRRIVNMPGFRSVAQVTGMEEFLEHYGVKVDRDFVLDAQSQRISLQSQQGQFAISNIMNYPAIPLADRLNKDHPLTRSLDVLGFPFVHPLSPATTEQTSLTFKKLAESSPYSWISPGLSFMDPYSLPQPRPNDPRGPFSLAAVVEGSTTTYTDPHKIVESLKMVVVGTSFFMDPQMPIPESNLTFFLSLSEWLSQDPHLLAIPRKKSPFRPLKQLSAGGRSVVKVLGLFFLPALVIFGAFLHWRNRQRRRHELQSMFDAPAQGA